MKLRMTLWALLIALALLAGCSLAVNPNLQARPAAAIEPKAGAWQTWVLTSTAAVRPPAPPDPAATQAELQQMKTMAAQLNDPARQQITYWDAGSPSYRWVQIAFDEMEKNGSNPPRNVRVIALVNVAIYDALIAAWDAKYHYNRARPGDADPTLNPIVATPHSPSYPS
jgi:hypothetical protein